MDELSQRRLNAIILIQKWFRRFQARLEARRRAAWVVCQSIEYSSEASLMHLCEFFNSLLQHQSDKTSRSAATRFNERLQQYSDRDDKKLLAETTFEDITIEKGYNGPHLSFPLTATHVHLIIASFKRGEQLHARYLLQLLHETRLLLKTKPNIYQVSTSISKQVTVVGDLHGQLDDLFLIFYKNGLPDVTNPYVFNGDYVDRGPNSVEVVALLFACLLVWPTSVFLNRGSHEDQFVFKNYGFSDELQQRYQGQNRSLQRLFHDVFAWLPVASIIDERILVAHGGISNKLDLNVVRKLDRRQFASPAYLHQFPVPSVDRSELSHVMDLLWSDPVPQTGCPPSTRGGGYLFGPDVTADFLKRHGLSMIIRSHQAMEYGFKFCHRDTVLTVFSASNYYSGTNYGAYVKLDSSGKPQTVQFVSGGKEITRSISRRITAMEEDALRGLRAQIAASKTELVQTFTRHDPNRTGSVTAAEWVKVMKSTLMLDLPWWTLRPHLAELGSVGGVMYMSTFQRVAIQLRLGSRAEEAPSSSSTTEILYKYKGELETIFRIMDQDCNGYLSIEEFKECCSLLGRATRQPIPAEDVTSLSRMLDINKDGRIDFKKFLEAFRTVDFQQQQGHAQG